MKLNHTTVQLPGTKVFSQSLLISDKKLSAKFKKKLLAKDCSMCSQNWVHSNESRFSLFFKKLLKPSLLYCRCEVNKL